MILKLTKTLNGKNEFTLINFTMSDSLDNITLDSFNNKRLKVIDTPEYYYYYIKDIIDIGNGEKFKIKAKKGDIVSITARNNNYIVFPSKRTFAIAFNLKYQEVLDYTYKEVLLNDVPYEVKYIKDNEDKVNDGVVYTLSQLVSYISILIKSHNYSKVMDVIKKNDDPIKRVVMKYYSNKGIKVHKKYELNVKTVWFQDGKWHSSILVNVSNSNKFLYDYYLMRMFAYMILTKSKSDREKNNDQLYCFNDRFDSIEDVYKFLEERQNLVNNFLIETEILFNRPNDMYTGYAPYVNGIYMFYEYNGVKKYIYRTEDDNKFRDKTLKQTYVSKWYRHCIKNIKSNYSI